ncbi:hypothetical protein R3W88_014635 [Solanum pinnatisectum]|uniref:Retrotransposon gag domain-containing protein n=1 Tax=Solanum pinnatisectum TaxID=50273 RepID=A0AAV9KTG1_9SOLN|nr:hypothetical protein R3W88_014635 [Solanum pinnatisectum]
MPYKDRNTQKGKDKNTSPIPPSPEDLKREVEPQEPPINATEQFLKNPVQLLTRIVASHGQRQEGLVTGTSAVDRAAGMWIRDFLNWDPSSFTESDPNDDPQDFIDQIQCTLDFKKAFLDHYLPLEIREARADQFLNLHQGSMSVREYSLNLISWLGACQFGTNIYFGCGTPGHMMRNYPRRGVGGVAQPTRSIVASSSSAPSLGRGLQISIGCGRGFRGAASFSGVQNRTYGLGDQQNLEASPDVVTGTLSIFHILYMH